ncbi:MAG: hypothetical protein IT422_06015 [Pirellulaceae bacterium]|nr:hypothetical protein [Pirellulaceae bacterium]
MPLPSVSPGWTINFVLESGHIDADLTPPDSIEDLIKAPSTTMTANFPIGYPAREDALATLTRWLDFALRDAAFFRKIHERGGNVEPGLRGYLDRKDRYLAAVKQLINET